MKTKKHVIRIRSVTPLPGLRVRLAFDDGTSRELDLSGLMRGPIFDPLKRDENLFREVRVDPELGTIVWPNGADLDPDVLYGIAEPD
ncbi:MAG: DUF2442 domain-containing protein [Actinomycetota bacterium]|nr:DUF2442 domain-containing protein [Actinomycetota bacterium]